MNTHTHNKHAYLHECIITSDSLVYNKTIVRMATARRRTTANRTALSAVTARRRSAEIWSILSGQDPVVWGLKLMNQCQSTGPKSMYVKLGYNAMIQLYSTCYTLYSICTAAHYINTYITQPYCHAKVFRTTVLCGFTTLTNCPCLAKEAKPTSLHTLIPHTL